MCDPKENVAEQSTDSVHSNMVKITKKTLPTTAKMVDYALVELHSKTGVSLKRLNSFIQSKYAIELTKHRTTLIKKRLLQLRESNDIINKTGKGFVGCFKLEDKKKFIKKFETEFGQRLTVSGSIKIKTSKRSKSRKVTSTQSQVDVRGEATKMKAVSSIFDISGDAPTLSPITPPMACNMNMMQKTPVTFLPVKKLHYGASYSRRRLFYDI